MLRKANNGCVSCRCGITTITTTTHQNDLTLSRFRRPPFQLIHSFLIYVRQNNAPFNTPPLWGHMQAIILTIVVSIRYGMWGEVMGCQAKVILTWLSLGALSSCGFLRVYRYHDILVKHDGVMWPITWQVREGGRNLLYILCHNSR